MLVSIGCGLITYLLVPYFGVRITLIFALSFVLCGGAIVFLTWNENWGSAETPHEELLRNCVALIKTGEGNVCFAYIIVDSKIRKLALIQAFFEPCICVFIFIWTPALNKTGIHNVAINLLSFFNSIWTSVCLFYD